MKLKPSTIKVRLQKQLDLYDRINNCTPVTPWCKDPNYSSNSGHYEGHPRDKDKVIEKIKLLVQML